VSHLPLSPRVEVAADGAVHPEAASIVAEFNASIASRMSEPVGRTAVALDARFATVRTQESNVGNYVADALRRSVGARVALLNAGTLRADRILGPGPPSLLIADDVCCRDIA